MKRKIELDDFIDALVEAKNLVALSDQWERKLASYEEQEAKLRGSLDSLAQQERDAKASVEAAAAAAAAEIQRHQATLDQYIARARTDHERAMAGLAQALTKSQQYTESQIAAYAASEQQAKASAAQAQHALDDIQQRLAQAKSDAKRLAMLAG